MEKLRMLTFEDLKPENVMLFAWNMTGTIICQNIFRFIFLSKKKK